MIFLIYLIHRRYIQDKQMKKKSRTVVIRVLDIRLASNTSAQQLALNFYIKFESKSKTFVKRYLDRNLINCT